MSNKFDIPVLFVLFNRKDVALTSFERIRRVRPQRLYIAADGPRIHVQTDFKKTKETRQAIIDLIDWDCDTKILFQDQNLGCGRGVYTALNWFFSQEEKGIILEDDCVVQDTFFSYMKELLDRYEKDERIGMIAGYNSLSTTFSNDSYCFSKYKGCWGWATWKRAWRNMDINLIWRDSSQCNSILKNMGYQGKDAQEWRYKLKKIDQQIVSAWDWQWYFSLGAQNQLCIFPSVSLVSNIGVGEDATHTQNTYSEEMKAKYEISFPLKHPSYITPNEQFDECFYKKSNSAIKKLRRFLPASLNKKAKIFFNKITFK